MLRRAPARTELRSVIRAIGRHAESFSPPRAPQTLEVGARPPMRATVVALTLAAARALAVAVLRNRSKVAGARRSVKALAAARIPRASDTAREWRHREGS
jgi:hypothetical protein